MNINDLMEICKDYEQLGYSVSEQLRSVLEGESMDEQNPNALRYIADFLDDTAAILPFEDMELIEDVEAFRDRINNYLENIRDKEEAL